MANGVKDDDEGFVIKVRGLPWSTTVDEILKFFGECSITHGKAGIHMTMSREGRPSGEAYIEMDSEEDIEKACKRDRDHMGHRYIEVFRAKRGEMEWVVKRSGLNLENAMDDGCVRLRGLPFGCSKEEIAQFFSGLEILPNGISLPTDYTGRSTGEAYVQFVNKDVAERALQKHKEKIGHRYIEIFRSSLSEVRASIGPKMRGGPMGGFNQRPAPYDRGSRFGGMNRFNNNMRGGNRGMNRDFDNGPMWNNGNSFPPRGNMMRGGNGGGGGGGMGPMDMKESMGNFRGNDNWNDNMMDRGRGPLPRIHMRGLPFRATEQDIADFFRPVVPLDIEIIFENGGRASGEADVEFATHEEAVRAMSKDRSHMSHRYIELFLNSPGIGAGNGNGGGNNMMGGGPAGGRMDNMGGPVGRMDNMGGSQGRMDNMGGLGNRMDNMGSGRMDNMGGLGNRMDNMGSGRMDNMGGLGNRMDNMGSGRMDNMGGGGGSMLGGIGSFCGGSGSGGGGGGGGGGGSSGGGMANNFRSGGGNVNYPIRGGGGNGGGGNYGGNQMNSGNYNNY